jgi:exosortase
MAKRKRPVRPQLGTTVAGKRSGGGSKKRRGGSASELTRSAMVPESKRVVKDKPAAELVPIGGPARWPLRAWAVLAVAAAVIAFFYWPTFAWIVDAWRREPDYGHGWLVIPLALFLCYQRSDSFPGMSPEVAWAGLSLVLLAFAMRIVGRLAYADFLDAYSVMPLIAGTVWCLLGLRAMLWALPAIGFLFFAVPLPYAAETMLSWRLQGVATELSTFFLRAFGQPAVAESHVIWLGQERLSVEEACSGLRIFVGMAAFAYFWVVLCDRSWTDRLVVAACALPAAILVNAGRIVTIGLFYQLTESEAMRRYIHDLSGYAMIFVSFALLGGVAWYWQRIYKRVPIMTARETLRGSLGHS